MATYLTENNKLYISDVALNDGDVLVDDQPSPYHYFNFDIKDWEVNLDSLKEAKLNEIYEAFDYRLYENIGFYSQIINKVINSTREDLDNMKKLLDKMQKDNIEETYFRCFDDTDVVINQTQLQAMIDELIDFGLYLYHKKWEYEYIINNATTIDDIINLVWED